MPVDASPTVQTPRSLDPAAATTPFDAMAADERQRALHVLAAEYAVLLSSVGAVWSASLTRTSLFLGVLSAAGVALGFAAQAGADSDVFSTLALIVLPLVLFLGVATFARLVQVQREAIVYITGMNRIRNFFQQSAPGTRPYFVLPPHDDMTALYRSMGTGMNRRPPPRNVMFLAVQTQGIVGVVTGVVAGAFAGLLATPAGRLLALLVAVVAFVVVVALLFAYWQRSLAELQASIRPLHPTPPEEVGAPF